MKDLLIEDVVDSVDIACRYFSSLGGVFRPGNDSLCKMSEVDFNKARREIHKTLTTFSVEQRLALAILVRTVKERVRMLSWKSDGMKPKDLASLKVMCLIADDHVYLQAIRFMEANGVMISRVIEALKKDVMDDIDRRTDELDRLYN